MGKDTKFKPGQSGNPRGKPRGAQDKRTALRELLRPHAEELINKAVSLAKKGDTTALKMCLDRLIAPYRAKDPVIAIEGMTGTLTEKGERIITAMGAGELTPSDAAAMLHALAAQAKVVEIDELEKRVKKLEGKIHDSKAPS